MKRHACYWYFFILFSDMSDIFYVHYCALTSFLDSALWIVIQVRIYSHPDHSLCMF